MKKYYNIFRLIQLQALMLMQVFFLILSQYGVARATREWTTSISRSLWQALNVEDYPRLSLSGGFYTRKWNNFRFYQKYCSQMKQVTQEGFFIMHNLHLRFGNNLHVTRGIVFDYMQMFGRVLLTTSWSDLTFCRQELLDAFWTFRQTC